LANSATNGSGIAGRYAASLFELALNDGRIEACESALARFEALVKGSEDLQRLLRSPVFSAQQQLNAVDAILDKARISGLAGNFIRVVARNRRLFALTGMIAEFRKLLAEHRGEQTADVTMAHALDVAQKKELKAALKSMVGKDVVINETVDPSLLGGMIVKIGSRQIDTSIRTKLSTLKLALKEVG
jgi:F-type H+-transporting ATPase subunit delta